MTFPNLRALAALLGVLLLAACAPASSVTPPTVEPLTTPTRVAIAATPTTSPTIEPTPEETAEPTPEPLPPSDALAQGMIHRRNADYPRAIASFRAVLTNAPSPELAREAAFRLGEAYYLAGDNRALAALSDFLKSNPADSHAARVKYFLAQIYRGKRDYPTALNYLRAYRAQTRALAGITDAEIADWMLAAGDAIGAIAQYDAALKDTTLVASKRIAILKKIADIHTSLNEPSAAVTRLTQALALPADDATRADLEYRLGRAYSAAGQNVQAAAHWKNAVGKYPDAPGAYQALVELVNRNVAVDEFQRGLVDFHAGQYDVAVQAFTRYLKANPKHDAEAHYYTAQAYEKKRAWYPAFNAYDEIIKTHPNDKRIPDAWLGKAHVFENLGKIDDAVYTYKRFVTLYPQNALADEFLWRAARLLDNADRFADAIPVYTSLASKYPVSDHAADALTNTGLDYYRLKNYAQATQTWQSAVQKYPSSSARTRALFWLGKTAKAQKNPDAARKYWTQAAVQPRGYYGWRAFDALNAGATDPPAYDLKTFALDDAAGQAELEKWLVSWNPSLAGVKDLSALPAPIQNDARFRRGAELLTLARTVEARAELSPLDDAFVRDAHALYALTVYYRANNLYSLAIASAGALFTLAPSQAQHDAPRYIEQWLYPPDYADLVTREAKKNKLDPALLFGLIRQESGFNPWSTSGADARGLMQVIPDTGKWIARALKVNDFDASDLYKPYISVQFGAYFLGRQIASFDNLLYALAAYNAGPGRVPRWQNADPDLAVEDIDLAETATYVRAVYAQYRQYRALYEGE